MSDDSLNVIVARIEQKLEGLITEFQEFKKNPPYPDRVEFARLQERFETLQRIVYSGCGILIAMAVKIINDML